MGSQRTHDVTTTDRVTIAGTVHGQGPPLVFLHGGTGDGDLDWNQVVEHLAERFTCHLPSIRGRGLSGDHPDLSAGRLIDDIVTYLDSIGEPAGLAGWSGGANSALGIAAQSDMVSAVALYEPLVASLMDEQAQATVGEAVTRAGELANQGNLTAAMRAFAGYPFSDDDIAMAVDTGYFEAGGRYVPHLLNLMQQSMEGVDPSADAAVLGAISAPVVVLYGSSTKRWFTASARHVADHVPNGRTREIPGAAHAAPLTHPEALAEALTEFFSPGRQPV